MKRRRRPSRKVVVVGVVAVLLIAGAGTGTALKLKSDRDKERENAAAERLAAEREADEEEREADEAAEELREDRRAAKRALESAERKLRLSAIREMQKSITTDARDSVGDGLLDGPILYTSCDPLGGGSVDDLTALTTTFDCLAVNEELGDGRARGYGFSATMNWDEGSYTWQLG